MLCQRTADTFIIGHAEAFPTELEIHSIMLCYRTILYYPITTSCAVSSRLGTTPDLKEDFFAMVDCIWSPLKNPLKPENTIQTNSLDN